MEGIELCIYDSIVGFLMKVIMEIYLYTEKNVGKNDEHQNISCDFFSRRKHKCLSSPINTFLYLGSKMILYYFNNLRKAVNLFLKGCDNGYFDQ